MRDYFEGNNDLREEEAVFFMTRPESCHIQDAFLLWTDADSEYSRNDILRGRMLICEGRSNVGQKAYDQFQSKLGCCCADYRELPRSEQLVKMLVEVIQAMVRSNIKPAVAARALTNIKEFSCIFADDLYYRLGLTVPTEEDVEAWYKDYQACFKTAPKD